jgi:hypothetical protein
MRNTELVWRTDIDNIRALISRIILVIFYSGLKVKARKNGGFL